MRKAVKQMARLERADYPATTTIKAATTLPHRRAWERRRVNSIAYIGIGLVRRDKVQYAVRIVSIMIYLPSLNTAHGKRI